MRGRLLPAAAAVAFLGGALLAGAGDQKELLAKLREHQSKLARDLAKIERACADVLEIRKTRESGEFVLNEEEEKMERQGREDFHIFMERFRNDTLEVLEILDRALAKEDFVEPLRRVYGDALDQTVPVEWDGEDFDTLIAELEEDYGVKINVSGEIDVRRTVSLKGEMSLLSVLLQLENLFDGRFIVKDGHLWLVLVPPPDAPGKGAGAK